MKAIYLTEEEIDEKGQKLFRKWFDWMLLFGVLNFFLGFLLGILLR